MNEFKTEVLKFSSVRAAILSIKIERVKQLIENCNKELLYPNTSKNCNKYEEHSSRLDDYLNELYDKFSLEFEEYDHYMSKIGYGLYKFIQENNIDIQMAIKHLKTIV